jgi:hypothetical protein
LSGKNQEFFDNYRVEVKMMHTKFTLPIRLIVSMLLIIGVVCASPGVLSNSKVSASDIKFYLPALYKAPIVTAFGAFLDADQAPYQGLPQMSAAGASWTRIPILWSQVQGSIGGPYTWGKIVTRESLIMAAANKGISAILYIGDTPNWALKSGFVCGAVAQDKFSNLVSFLTDMVQRYSAFPYNVRYYELWNEPDVVGSLGCWGDASDTASYGGKYYAEMLKVAYPAIKKANPQAQVLFGGLLLNCDPVNVCPNDPVGKFLKGALDNGAGPYFDGVSFHAYDYYWGLGNYSNPNWNSAWNTTGPVYLVKAAYIRGLLAKYNLTGKYLMNTELAVLCGHTGQETYCTNPEHSATVGSYLVQAMAGSKADGILVSIWFSAGGWRGSGLLGLDQSLLPSYNAFKFARSKLGEAVFVRAVTEFSGINGYEFTNGGHRLWVLWSVTSAGNPHLLTVATAPTAVYDTYGSPIPLGNPSTSLSIDLMPVYVEF